MSKTPTGLKLDVGENGITTLGLEWWSIVDAGQEERPEVCCVWPVQGESSFDTMLRAKALAELIEIGWRVRYGNNEEEL